MQNNRKKYCRLFKKANIIRIINIYDIVLLLLTIFACIRCAVSFSIEKCDKTSRLDIIRLCEYAIIRNSKRGVCSEKF